MIQNILIVTDSTWSGIFDVRCFTIRKRKKLYLKPKRRFLNLGIPVERFKPFRIGYMKNMAKRDYLFIIWEKAL